MDEHSTSPGGQWHIKDPILSSHVPPFWQGFGLHSSISRSHKTPDNLLENVVLVTNNYGGK